MQQSTRRRGKLSNEVRSRSLGEVALHSQLEAAHQRIFNLEDIISNRDRPRDRQSQQVLLLHSMQSWVVIVAYIHRLQLVVLSVDIAMVRRLEVFLQCIRCRDEGERVVLMIC